MSAFSSYSSFNDPSRVHVLHPSPSCCFSGHSWSSGNLSPKPSHQQNSEYSLTFKARLDASLNICREMCLLATSEVSCKELKSVRPDLEAMCLAGHPSVIVMRVSLSAPTYAYICARTRKHTLTDLDTWTHKCSHIHTHTHLNTQTHTHICAH